MLLIACDLDGTVVRADRSIGERVVRALRSHVARGSTVMFITGRSPHIMYPLPGGISFRDEIICANGALWWNQNTRRCTRIKGLSVDTVSNLIAVVEATGLAGHWSVETADRVLYEYPYLVAGDRMVGEPVARVGGHLGGLEPVVKVLFRLVGPSVDDALSRLRGCLPSGIRVTHGSLRFPILEFSSVDADKGVALTDLAGELGVEPGDVIAFGDQRNDAGMLEWAGTGFAMADGHPAAIAAADFVVPPVAEDGVAVALEALL